MGHGICERGFCVGLSALKSLMRRDLGLRPRLLCAGPSALDLVTVWEALPLMAAP